MILTTLYWTLMITTPCSILNNAPICKHAAEQFNSQDECEMMAGSPPGPVQYPPTCELQPLMSDK
jgi:hypothetical protein